MLAHTILASVSCAVSSICAIGGRVTTGTGWFVIELTAALVQAEVSSARIAIIAICRCPTGALPRQTAIVQGAGIAVVAGNVVSFWSETAFAADWIASTLQAGCVNALGVTTGNGGVGLHDAQMR